MQIKVFYEDPAPHNGLQCIFCEILAYIAKKLMHWINMLLIRHLDACLLKYLLNGNEIIDRMGMYIYWGHCTFLGASSSTSSPSTHFYNQSNSICNCLENVYC